jgi:hypothetical protein
VCKQKLSAWHTGAYETFCGMDVTTIFFNGMWVNHSLNPACKGTVDTEMGRAVPMRNRAINLPRGPPRSMDDVCAPPPPVFSHGGAAGGVETRCRVPCCQGWRSSGRDQPDQVRPIEHLVSSL